HETFRIEEIVDPVLGRKRKVIIAAGTNAQILRKLDVVHDIAATRTLLEKAVRDVAFLATFRLQCRFLENCHGSYARAAVAAGTESAPAFFKTRAHSLRVD